MRPVLLASCAAFPDGDEDSALLLAALRDLGVDARWAVWDDPSVDWTPALVVLRATWDYPLRRAQFLDWIASLPEVHNPLDIVTWNSDKVYLHELETADIPVTPTEVIAPGDFELRSPAGEFVVKPSVGAGSRGVGRFGAFAGSSATAHVEELHAAGLTALVQPYLADVDDVGETALVYIDGVFSHAIRKGPMLRGDAVYPIDRTTGLFVPENITPREASPAELAVGEQAVAYVRDRFGAAPLYARIDLLPGPAGPVVIELELTEPSLFLSYADASASRFAAAIAARI